MANYPAFQYQPQMPAYGPQLQPVYPTYPQPQQTPQEQNLFCRRATNREEVQAYPVDFSGRPMTFLGPGETTIWTKVFDPSTGGSIVTEYCKAAPDSGKPAFASASDFDQLLAIVRQQGEEIEQLKALRRRANREAEVDSNAV